MSALLEAIAATQSADKGIRTNGENYLTQQLQQTPGDTLLELVKIGCSPPTSDGSGVAPHLALLAIIRAKRFMVQDNSSQFCAQNFPQQLQMIKQISLQSLPTMDNKCRKQLLEIFTVLMESQWPELVPTLVTVLQEPVSQNSYSRHTAALEVMYSATKEFKLFSRKGKLLDFQPTATAVLPLLPQLFAYNDVEVARLCLKIFECFTARTTPDLLNSNSALFDSWIQFLLGFPAAFTQVSQQPEDSDAYKKYLACIKRIGSISLTLLQEGRAKKSGVKRMSRYFAKTYSARFGEFWVHWLRYVKQKDPLEHYKSTRFALSYLKEGVDNKRVYTEAILPCAGELITELLFTPYIPFTKEDAELFDSDPAQFLVESHFQGAKEISLRGLATSLIKKLVAPTQDFHDKSLLQQLLLYVGKGMQEPDGPMIDGSFELLMSLKKQLKSDATMWQGGQMETVVGQYVVPRTTSSVHYVRAKAVQVLGAFSSLPYSSEENYAAVLRAILQCAQDQHIVVSVGAFTALNMFLRTKRAAPYVRPLLLPIVEEVCRLIPRQGELLVITLRLLVEKFFPELKASVPTIVNVLVQHCLAIEFQLMAKIGTAEAEAEDIEDAELGAIDNQSLTILSSIKTLEAVFEQLEYDPDLSIQLQPEIARLMESFIRDGEELGMADEIASLLRVCVFTGGHRVDPSLWKVLKTVFTAVSGQLSAFEEYAGAIENYFSADPVTFLSNESNILNLVEIYKAVMEQHNVANSELVLAAPPMISAAFQYFKAHHHQFDGAAATILNITLHTLMASEDTALRVQLCTVVMDALYYNGNNILSLMQQSGALQPFLQHFFPFFNQVKDQPSTYSQLERRTIVLGLLSLFYNGQSMLDGETLHQALQVIHWCVMRNGQCYEAFLADTVNYDPAEAEENADLAADEVDDEEYEDDDDEGEKEAYDEDDLGVDDDMDDWRAEGGEAEGEVIDLKGKNPLNDLDPELITPLNDVCEIESLLQWLQTTQQQYPDVYAQQCAALPIAEYTKAKDLSAMVRQRMAELKTRMEQYVAHRCATAAAAASPAQQ